MSDAIGIKTTIVELLLRCAAPLSVALFIALSVNWAGDQTVGAQTLRVPKLSELQPLPLPKKLTPDDWSFRNFPLLRQSQLSDEDLWWLSSREIEVQSAMFCTQRLELRRRLYERRYPRYAEIAHLPMMQRRFLHWGAEIATDDDNWCFVTSLFQSFFENGTGRCNLKIDINLPDPDAQAHRDKIVELVEKRHTSMMGFMIKRMISISSNVLNADTLHYLLLHVEPDLEGYFPRELVWEQINSGAPERLRFVEAAAMRNDFRSVLRTSPPCSDDAINYFRGRYPKSAN